MGARTTTEITTQLAAIEAAGGKVGLLTALASAGAAGTEVSTGNWTNYARVAVLAHLGTASAGQVANDVAFDFGTATILSGTVTVLGAAIYVGDTAAQTHFMALGSTDPRPFTATTADVLTCPGHSLVDGNPVVLDPPGGGGALPTGLSASTVYYVRDTSSDTFKLAATAGGAAIDITVAGSGFIQKLESKVVNNGDSVTIPIGSLVIKEV